MTMKMKHFDELNGAESILLSAEGAESLSKLLETIDRIIIGANESINLSELNFTQPINQVELTLKHSEKNKGLYKNYGGVWVLELNNDEWLQFTEMLKSVVMSGSGHQYIDSQSDDISFIVSLNEYQPDWVGWDSK